MTFFVLIFQLLSRSFPRNFYVKVGLVYSNFLIEWVTYMLYRRYTPSPFFSHVKRLQASGAKDLGLVQKLNVQVLREECLFGTPFLLSNNSKGFVLILHDKCGDLAIKSLCSNKVHIYVYPQSPALLGCNAKCHKLFYYFRVIFGPELVMLGPDEQFTQLSLSGGKPKKPNVIKALCLLLGPDFCTDIVVVETADHARLSLQLSYNWWVFIV